METLIYPLRLTYPPLLIFIVITSILFSMMVGMRITHFPAWMAAINLLQSLLHGYYLNATAAICP